MIKIIRNATEHHIELQLSDRVVRLDMNTLPQNRKAGLYHKLFQWKRKGYVGYPDI